MQKQTILTVMKLAIALPLLAAAPAFAQESLPLQDEFRKPIQESKQQQAVVDGKILKGLVKVTREPRKHWYTPHFRGEPTFHVSTADSEFIARFDEDTFKSIKKAYKKANNESFPDLRSYEDAHPKWVKTQNGFKHWNPVLQGSSNFIVPAGVLVGGYMAGRTKQTVTVAP